MKCKLYFHENYLTKIMMQTLFEYHIHDCCQCSYYCFCHSSSSYYYCSGGSSPPRAPLLSVLRGYEYATSEYIHQWILWTSVWPNIIFIQTQRPNQISFFSIRGTLSTKTTEDQDHYISQEFRENFIYQRAWHTLQNTTIICTMCKDQNSFTQQLNTFHISNIF